MAGMLASAALLCFRNSRRETDNGWSPSRRVTSCVRIYSARSRGQYVFEREFCAPAQASVGFFIAMPTLTIDGRPVTVPNGTTILEAARTAGVDVPTLCWYPKLPV